MYVKIHAKIMRCEKDHIKIIIVKQFTNFSMHQTHQEGLQTKQHGSDTFLHF